MSAGWGNNSGGGGWEDTTDPTWGTAPHAAALEQPAATVVDATPRPNGQNSVNTNSEDINTADNTHNGAAPGDGAGATAERGANPEWTGHGQAKYNYDEFASRGGAEDFEGNARVYHWDGEEGDVGPEFPELELELFGPPDQRNDVNPSDFAKQVILFLPSNLLPFSCLLTCVNRLVEIQLEQEGPVRTVPVVRFEDAGLHPAMAKNVDLCGYKVPTTIQKYCLPAISAGHDVIGIAQTGKSSQ